MRKSRILTFLFALWPGAGQMYLGYMKRGVSLMGLFFLIFAIMGFLGLSFLAFLLPPSSSLVIFASFTDRTAISAQAKIAFKNISTSWRRSCPQTDFIIKYFPPKYVSDLR